MVRDCADKIRTSLALDYVPRSRNDSNISVQDLIQSGLVHSGDLLVGPQTVEGQAVAIVLPNGQVEIEGGAVFDALSPAAMSVRDDGVSTNGWDFWVHEASGQRMAEIRNAFTARNKAETLWSE